MLKQLRKAEDALDQVNPRAHLNLDDLYAAGGALTMVTGYLADAVRLGIGTSVNVLVYEPVYDDTEDDDFFRANDGGQPVDPQTRIDAALAHLDEVHRYLTMAREHASRYHTAIGHIGVRPDAEDEEGES